MGVPLSDLRLSSPDLVELLNDEKDVLLPKDPTDPLFDKEWYLVSGCIFALQEEVFLGNC